MVYLVGCKNLITPLNATVKRAYHRRRGRRRPMGWLKIQSAMRPMRVVEVDNPRHIILSGRRSVIRGIRFGLTVAVYEGFIKRGESLCRCGFEEERSVRSIEIPTWMLEPAACCRLRMMAVPAVSCDALLCGFKEPSPT